MNYITGTTSLYGIDYQINELQEVLYENLNRLWKNITGHGKAYKNRKGGDSAEYIAEVYIKDGEYKDVYYDDRRNGSFFFLIGSEDSTEDQEVFVSDVKIVFMINLQSIFNTRNDAKAHNDIVDIITEHSNRAFRVTGIERGISNIMSGYDAKDLKRLDFHPYHTFAVVGKMSYDIKHC